MPCLFKQLSDHKVFALSRIYRLRALPFQTVESGPEELKEQQNRLNANKKHECCFKTYVYFNSLSSHAFCS